jgi:hypothetical protein
MQDVGVQEFFDGARLKRVLSSEYVGVSSSGISNTGIACGGPPSGATHARMAKGRTALGSLPIEKRVDAGTLPLEVVLAVATGCELRLGPAVGEVRRRDLIDGVPSSRRTIPKAPSRDRPGISVEYAARVAVR